MLLVLGWDGACFELVDRFRSEGRMPALDALLRRGRAWRVRSTTPAVTFPAWTTFLTGAEPDHHGVTDFTAPRPGSYGVRFLNATHRRLPTALARLSDAGLRVGQYGVPATWPPEERGVFEICGFDTPLGATGGARATHPRELADRLRRRHGRLGVEGVPQSRIDEGWHERTRARLVTDVELRTRIACELLRDHDLDVFVVHFMEPDTASHHYWQFDDVASPRHRRGPTGVLADVYAALDRSLADLLDAAGAESSVLLLSDHGSAGASDRVVFWNRMLADLGWLGFRPTRGEGLAVRLRRAALDLLPPGLQARAFAAAGPLAGRLESGARFSGIDWKATRAYSDELPYFPSIRLNLEGREPEGIVSEEDRGAVVEELTAQLLALRDPFDGGAVVEAVRRREDLFDGPFLHHYPDLILELRRPEGYAYGAGSSRAGLEREAIRRFRAGEASGAKGSATSGVHGDFGLGVVAAPGIEVGRAGQECRLADLTVTMLALAGVSPSEHMRGRCLLEVGHDLRAPGAAAATPVTTVEYGEAEEREVEERLRALGYLP